MVRKLITKKLPRVFIKATDDNGNWDNPFIVLYEEALADYMDLRPSESDVAIIFQQYCQAEVPGARKVLTHFYGGVFTSATIIFKDEASLTYFRLKYE